MECVLLNLCPPASLGLIFPDENLAVIRARCENIAKFWVCPRNLPNGSRVANLALIMGIQSSSYEPFQCMTTRFRRTAIYNVKYLHRPVGGASSQSFSVVV